MQEIKNIWNAGLEGLRLEWLKYNKNTLARIVFGVFTVGFSLLILYGKKIIPQASPPLPGLDTYYTFPTIWDYQGHIGNWMVCVLLGFMMVHFFTGEVSAKTLRQGIINGQTRKDFFIAKIAVIVAIASFATLIYVLSTIIIGVIHTGDLYPELIFDTNGIIFRFWLMSVGYLSLAFLISNIFRSSGIAIIFYFGYVFVLEFILRMTQYYFFRNRSMLFWPQNVIEDLVPNPFFKLPSFWMEKEWGFSPLLTSGESLLFGLIYTPAIIYLTWLIFKKRDI